MAPLQTERYFEATVDETWTVLKHIVNWRYKKVVIDELSKGISFKSGVGLFTGNQNCEVSVSPAEDGCLLRVSAVGSISTAVGNGAAQADVARFIFQHTGEFIEKERAKN